MADVVLFGATGYTGRLTAHALARRSIDFSIVGRDAAKLDKLASETGGPTARLAEVGDVNGLIDAVKGARVLITCVGPFAQLGETAVRAALEAGVHYIDSTGESSFVAGLFEHHDDAAQSAGIAMAPAMGFDDVPADFAATIATEGLGRAGLVLTYQTSTTPSGGTARTMPDLLRSGARWIERGREVRVRLGERERWAPFPAPLGPKPSVSAPFVETILAPTHLDLESLETYIAVTTAQRHFLRLGRPLINATLSFGPTRQAVAAVGGLLDGPGESARKRPWTILAEATSPLGGRNVVLRGTDVYGLTAELMAAGAAAMAAPDYDRVGVLAPTEAIGVDLIETELATAGVEIETHDLPRGG